MSVTDQHSKSRSKVNLDLSQIHQSEGKSVTALGEKSIKFNKSKVRRQSYGFGSISGMGTQVRQQSLQTGIEFKRPPLVYQNTYQLEPRVRFHVLKVTKAIDSILDSFYSNYKYSNIESPIKTMLVADEVMRTVKDMHFDRYRIIAVVTIAQKRAQSYNNAVAFLWNHEFDSIVNAQREEHTCFIQVTCFGVYLD